MNEILGIDVSRFETQTGVSATGMPHVPFDWELAQTHGIRVVTLRQMSGGTLDPQFEANWEDWLGSKTLIQPIAYQWLDLQRGKLVAQAKAWIGQMKSCRGMIMVDLEDWTTHTGWPGMVNELVPYLELISQAVGKRAWIYTGPSFIKQYFTPADVASLSAYPLVIAHWDTACPRVPLPFTVLGVAGWQFTGRAYAPWYGVRNGAKQAALYTFDLARLVA
jgi:GH25 family lysozyme M1 (1,4-beta-N-acetylmuramidase)